MRRVFRPLAVFSIASGVSLAVALQLMVGGARGHDGGGGVGAASFFPGYELARLDLVDPTLYHVSESYVDPNRLDWDAMFTAALDAIEHDVPVCLFTREPGGKLLSVEIGEFRTVLEVGPIRRRQDLQGELRKVAQLLSEHLDPINVPGSDGLPHPLAKVEYTLINGMLSTLDPHSVLLLPEDAHEMDVENQGEFGGLGITISMDPDRSHLVVDRPTVGGPAERAGLKADDRIVRIDGESTINMTLDDAVRRLRGPVGADVVIEVVRTGKTEPTRYTIERELVSINPVEGSLLPDSDIGIIKIAGFHEKVKPTMDEHLESLRAQVGPEGLGGLILDLRGNPGGFLNQAVKVADTFLSSGDIVTTVNGDGQQTDIDRADRNALEGFPIVVLVDASSASASEIVAGALRFQERAVILGERTFGKGSVQNLHPFSDNSKLKLTISKYLTPGDRSIQAIGIPADIELVASVVPPRPEPGADPAPIRLFHRERVRREADLDHSLEQGTDRLDDPAFRLRYLASIKDDPAVTEAYANDFQVTLAREVIEASRGWRRADVLATAHTVIDRRRQAADGALVEAFAARGIDWTNGPGADPADGLPLEVKVDVGQNDVLTAGKEQPVRVTVTNTSRRTLYRLAAVVVESDVIEGHEFFFGKLLPGQTRSFDHLVQVQAGWPAEEAPYTIDFRDAGDRSIGHLQTTLAVEQRALPRFAWSWEAREAKGDDDGIVEVGEFVAIDLTVTNVGAGPTVDPFARLRNKAGSTIDLVVGTLTPGVPRLANGKPCPDPQSEDCNVVLNPGETYTGSFELEVRGLPPKDRPLELELSLGDAEAYDHGSVVRGGFYDWFSQKETLAVVVGREPPRAELRTPPTVEITRAPELRVERAQATLSGVVTDEAGVTHVMVFHGDDKVFFEGGGERNGLRSVPFTADVSLDPGINVLTVLATDRDGFVSSESVLTWLDAETGMAHYVE
ncbi:MAG: S41 family peptidase [Myxococcota bacterium]